jgi:bacteriocin-like protein
MKKRKEKTVKSIKNFKKLSTKQLHSIQGGSQGVSTFDLVL